MHNIDADTRNADWLRVTARAREFGSWSVEAIDAECAAYDEYAAELRERHRHWPSSPEVERTSVFPTSHEWIAGSIGEHAWHDFWWAAKSSQTLALTLLAAAARSDPSLGWLPHAELLGRQRIGLFEVELSPGVLNERPRQTQLDFLAVGSTGVIAVEAKFSEKGFGTCSCARRSAGVCSERVLERPYWTVARRQLGLRRREGSCALSLAYQPVRNLAAAAAIAGAGRRAAFVLVYDNRNPFFSGSGAWPGWVSILHGLTAHSTTRFKALSWQELLARGPFDPSFVEWAMEKHGLEPMGNMP